MLQTLAVYKPVDLKAMTKHGLSRRINVHSVLLTTSAGQALQLMLKHVKQKFRFRLVFPLCSKCMRNFLFSCIILAPDQVLSQIPQIKIYI